MKRPQGRTRTQRGVVKAVTDHWRHHQQLLRRVWNGELASTGQQHGTLERIMLAIPQVVRLVSPRAAFGDDGTDAYVATCVFITFCAWGLSPYVPLTASIFAVWRITDSISHNVGVLFIDRRTAQDWQPRSVDRTLFFAFVTFIEVMVCFAILYLSSNGVTPAGTNDPITSPLDALYFSAVTMTTVGYGDLLPGAPLSRTLVVLQVLIAVGYLSIVLQGIVGIALDNRRVPSQRDK